MTLAHLMENAEDRGRKIGFQEERDRMKKVYAELKASDRLNEWDKAMEDEEYLESLFKEFGLK